MTATRAQSLLADSELTKAHDFLFEAHMLVTDVRSLFFNIGNFATAARLRIFRLVSPMNLEPLSA